MTQCDRLVQVEAAIANTSTDDPGEKLLQETMVHIIPGGSGQCFSSDSTRKVLVVSEEKPTVSHCPNSADNGITK